MRRAQRFLPAKNQLRDIYFAATFPRNLGWKHSRVRDPQELKSLSLLKAHDVIFLTITKNPYSWLLSLYKRPYHQLYREELTFEEFLQAPWATMQRDNIPGPLPSPSHLWNVKNQSYLGLDGLSRMNLTAESILLDPEAVIESISREFQIPRKTSDFKNFDESTKYEDKTSEYYQKYYINECWRSDVSDEAKQIINPVLDEKIMTYFSYSYLT